jgi:hypothetical protein
MAVIGIIYLVKATSSSWFMVVLETIKMFALHGVLQMEKQQKTLRG